MKRIFIICDGMADQPIPDLGYCTPLEFAKTPGMDTFAKKGKTGMIATIPSGFYPGSEVGILTILGYSPDELPLGRGPLETAGLGIKLNPNAVAGRYRLKNHTDINKIENRFPEYKFYPLSESSGIFYFEPDPDNCSQIQRNNSSDIIEFWSVDRPRRYESFATLHTLDANQNRVAVIGAVPLLAGIAKEISVDWIKPDGATGDGNTNYKSKYQALSVALNQYDFIILHIEACDFHSHAGDISGKVNAIENIDKYIVSPLLNIIGADPDRAIAIMSDHPSLVSSGNHSSDPSPFLYYRPGLSPDKTLSFSEKEANSGSLLSIHEIYG